jgi:hypothetical protein
MFIAIFVLIVGILVLFYRLVFDLLPSSLPLWTSIPISLLGSTVLFAVFLNIPLPRKRKDPASDLIHAEKIAEGAWCSVFLDPSDKSKVIKQLYFCGWGHNDYRKHRALVVGKEKICGKWNPLILWFLHNYMLLYQMIGLKRRLRFEHLIEALPSTFNINFIKLRYEQTFVPKELTVENCPSDIEAQFKKLNEDLERCGLYIDDVHAGNVRVTESGKIQIVDGELYSGGEEWVKSRLVLLVNGEMVSNMEKVLGNDRIVAWVDHRKRVDEIVRQALKKDFDRQL